MTSRLAVRATLRRALHLFRADWRTLVVLAVLVEIPVLIANVASINFLDIEIGVDVSRETIVAGLVLLAWSTLAHHVLIAAVEQVEAAERHGQPRIALGEIVRNLPYARLLVADVLITTAYLLGLVLLVVPGILVAVWTAPVFPLLRMEHRPVMATIRRSVQIVRGSAWRVFVIIGSVWLASEFVGLLVGGFLHDEPALDAIAHFAIALAFEPLAAAAVVVATFELVALHATQETTAMT